MPKHSSNSRASLQTTFIPLTLQPLQLLILHDLHIWSSNVSIILQFIVHGIQVHTFIILKGMWRLKHKEYSLCPQTQNSFSTHCHSFQVAKQQAAASLHGINNHHIQRCLITYVRHFISQRSAYKLRRINSGISRLGQLPLTSL